MASHGFTLLTASRSRSIYAVSGCWRISVLADRGSAPSWGTSPGGVIKANVLDDEDGISR